MTGPLLETKLHAPVRREKLVTRARLGERIDSRPDAKLIIVSAPPGFGKTTLLAQRQGTSSRATASAWLSLDATDDEPRAFWSHVASALRSVAPGLGTSALPAFESPEGTIRAGITLLLNDLRSIPTDLELVLDDYHIIEAPEIHGGMTFLLEHLPPRVRVVIATRADPPLPLARMRARGELVELRATDLRFTPDESAAYLNGAFDLGLVATDVDVLAQRTEGWIAALQLAALSVQGRDDAGAFIAGFAGNDRYIIDYLVDEVLERQPDAIRDFLLDTSILTSMCGSLCDAVTGERGGRAMLEALERRNLFVVPLDDRREWYRYHHLFADVLRTHLEDERPERVAELHRRASAWYDRHGEPSEAIGHAMAGGDHARAAELVELAMPGMNKRRQEGPLRRMLEALPAELLADHPVLSAGYAGALMSTGQFEGVEDLLDLAERAMAPGRKPAGIAVADEAEFERLPGTIAMYRTALALQRGDAADTLRFATQALDRIPEDDHMRRGGVASLQGLAHWHRGDLEQAYRWYGEGMASLERAGHRSDVVGGAVTLADIRIAEGRLRDAERLCEDGLALATREGGAVLRGAADMHVGLAILAYERNELATASDHLRQARELGEENGLPKNPWRSRVATARLRLAEGDAENALELVDDAERRYVGDFSPNVRPVGAVRARMWIAMGRLSDARRWASMSGVSPADEPTHLREFELATLARLLIAEGRGRRDEQALRAAGDLTDRLVQAADAGGRGGSAIDALVAGALARHARGDAAAALATLSRAIERAEPEGHVRAFLDEGPPMTSLLAQAAHVSGTASYNAHLLAAATAGADRRAGEQSLPEPLSDRELEVLRLLTTELSGPDIAAELVVSLNTLRTHTKNIYAKLGVGSRRAAVRRAAELDLLRGR